MTARSFVHLHCHSHYSLLDGASRIPELVKRAKSLGMNAIALTDHGNLYGAIEFYRECKAAGLNPIIGYEAYVAPQSRFDRNAQKRGDAGYHLTLLARDRQGFANLTRLASRAFLEGYYYVPRIDKQLLAEHKEGLICLSGCASAEFSELILNDRMDEALEAARWFAGTFGKHYYIEIQNNGLDIQKRCAEGAIDIAAKLGLPLVATSDAHYLCQADSRAHDVLLCINTGKVLTDPNRMRYGSDQFYVREPQEMYALFPNHEDAVERSQEIADGVAIDLDLKSRHFPVFTTPGAKSAEDYLRELCEEGTRKRYAAEPPARVRERLRHELDIICRMGFAGYFLIVWDFVRFAHENRIPAGARGSACASLASYVLGISSVDPLEFDLLFERFLDPMRSEAPDIDIDFCQERREEVINYVKRKYGEESVAQIATFGTLAARAAIKDVGRVLDMPLERVNQLTGMVPKTLGITLSEALEQSSELREQYESDANVKQLIDIAMRLEGTNRNVGTHAAGVVIANGPIIDYVPVQRMVRKGEDGSSKKEEAVITTQWVMGDLEKVGLLKMDFLGLRTFTLLDNAVRQIEKNHGTKIDLNRLPLDDRDTFALLQRGDARGVFQFESEGIRELLKRMKPDHVRDIIASTALYRPGPLQGGMVDMYIDCKHGRQKPEYAHPVMEELLRDTYGVMVYQEQVMLMLNRLGGIQLSSAYACIKAISKKKEEIINARRIDFVNGAVERGLAESTAQDIFEKIVKFGGYGFNKAHSAAYALVSYQTAYLKAHYTPEFMAALLTSEIDDGNKRDIMVEHIADARRFGVEVLPPCVNRSAADFAVSGRQVYFGLVAIKGVGRGAAQDIGRAREEGGPFRDIFDFCERIDQKAVPRAAVEKLIKAGALDAFGRRSQMLQVMPRAMTAAAEAQLDRRRGQMSLFGDGSPKTEKPGAVADELPDIPEWSDREKLKNEKEVLDFYLSSHPLAEVENDILRFSSHRIEQLLELAPNHEVLLGGMLGGVRFLNVRNSRNGNSRFVRCTIEDFTGQLECLMWPDELIRHKDDFADDRICFVRGTLDRSRDRPVLVLNRVLTMEQAQREQTRGLWLLLNLGLHSDADIGAIGRILRRTPGSCPVFLMVRDGAGKSSVLKLGHEFSINSPSFSFSEMETLLGPGNVKFAGA